MEISYKGKQDASQQRVFRIQNLLTNCKDHKKEIKDTLIQDLKAVTLKSWSQKSKDDVKNSMKKAFPAQKLQILLYIFFMPKGFQEL